MDLFSLIQQDANINNAFKSMLNESFIADFGVVLEVISKGVVKVGISVANRPKDIMIITCTLASCVSQSFAVNVIPKVNDKVVVIYPRRYDENMFDLDKNEVILNKSSKSYNAMSGIAFLANQYRENDYHNAITLDDGEVTVTNGNMTVKISKEGKLSIENNKGDSLFDLLDSIISKLNSGLNLEGATAGEYPVVGTTLAGQFSDESLTLKGLMS